VELQVGYNVAYRIPFLQAQGQIPNHEASVSKLYGSELTQRIARTGISMLGMGGQIMPGSPWSKLGGAFARNYLSSVSSTIAAGTSEVQRNIIAQRGLGLPRG
jgi:alkylation response protein AidB-like acyl-CoA dehydrogenase